MHLHFRISFQAAAIHGETVMLNQIKQRIHDAGLEMSELSYEYIIKGLCVNQELEHALDLLGEMTVRVDDNGQPDDSGKPAILVRPTLRSFMDVITVALKLHESETAYLVLKMAELQAGLTRIPATVYLDILAKAAEDHVVSVLPLQRCSVPVFILLSCLAFSELCLSFLFSLSIK